MPYRDLEKRRESKRLWARAARARARALNPRQVIRSRPAEAPPPPTEPEWPSDPAGALADWARLRLKVPPGHPLAGEPMELPNYLVGFIRDALAVETREAALFIGRKNAKSAGIAILILGFLSNDGPLRRFGWRCGILSVTRTKAHELLRQAEEIAAASSLQGLEFKRTPAPGKIVSSFGSCELESADLAAGHGSGYDLAVVDEIGLLKPRHRALVAGMRSSVSSRGGRFLSLSILGGSPFTGEILARRGSKGLAVHLYAADDGCALDDEAAWKSANPGLGIGIKSIDYMRSEVRRVKATPADESFFRAHDLNQPSSPDEEILVSLDDYKDLGRDAERDGACCVGLDVGGSRSMTALSAYWPRTGRLEVYGSFPSVPDLETRSEADRAGTLYRVAFDSGELWLSPGRVVNVGEFLGRVQAELDGVEVAVMGFDRYREPEVLQVLDDGNLFAGARLVKRGSGHSATADGSFDVRSFQSSVLTGKLRPSRGSLLLELALSNCVIRRDPAGNPAIDRQSARSRIDPAAASIIAVGLGALHKEAVPLGFACV